MKSPRTFAALRSAPIPAAERIEGDSIDQVLGRIAVGRDGQLLTAWLMAECQAPSHAGADADVLREAEGQRRAYGRLIEMLTA